MATGNTMPAGGGALQLEIAAAFSKNKKLRHQTAEQSWLHCHCTKDTSELFHHYEGDTTNVPPFEKQTFLQWKSLMEFERVTHPRRQRRKLILIQPLTHFNASPGYTHTQISPTVLNYLHKFCEAFFTGMAVQVNPAMDLSTIPRLTQRVHQDTNREQFLVGDILKYLKSRRPKEAYCTVGVTVADLYPSPEWNFVLGEASMNKGCGVFSFGRTFNSMVASCESREGDESQAKRLERDEDRIESEQFKNVWILMRVMTHELCHIFGLKHCYYFKCAMNDSKNIVEAATQPLFLCPICIKKVQKMVKFNLFQRYQKLLESIREIYHVVRDRTMAQRPCSVDKPVDVVSKDDQEGSSPNASVTQENGSSVVSCDQSGFHGNDSHHLRRIESAIEWLEKTLADLGEFEQHWVAPGKGSSKSKVV